MRYVYLGLVIVVTAVVLLFTIQNLAAVKVSFLTRSLSLPLSLLVFLAYLLGMMTGGMLWNLLAGWVRGARGNRAPR